MEHVRRRVDHAQRAIDVERVHAAAGHAEALRQHHLERVARQDVLLGPLDRRGEARAVEAGGRRLAAAPAQLRRALLADRRRLERRQRRRVAPQPLDHLVDAAQRAGVGRLRLLRARHVRRGHHLDCLAQVVEHDQRVGQDHGHVRQRGQVGRLGRARRLIGQVLEAAHQVVRHPADRAAPEARQALGRHRAPLAHHLDQRRGRLAHRPGRRARRAVAVHVVPDDAGLAAGGAQHGAGTDADERVRRPLLAADDRFEQEAVLAAAQLGVGADRRVAVGHDLPVNRDQVAPLRGLAELVERRVIDRRFRQGASSGGELRLFYAP